MGSLNLLDDQFLIEAYYNALKLDLDTDFIRILEEEILHRNLVK